MELGFDTVGNATLILHDKVPLLATDPWITGSAYFGSWGLAHEIRAEQLDAVRRCKYLWISHGHRCQRAHRVESRQVLRK